MRPVAFDLEHSSYVEKRQRVLLVERTGWGKSLVYFISAKLLREQGAGPTLLISPLLALMRNQIQMAERIGYLLREAGVTAVHPFALAVASGSAGDAQ